LETVYHDDDVGRGLRGFFPFDRLPE